MKIDELTTILIKRNFIFLGTRRRQSRRNRRLSKFKIFWRRFDWRKDFLDPVILRKWTKIEMSVDRLLFDDANRYEILSRNLIMKIEPRLTMVDRGLPWLLRKYWPWSHFSVGDFSAGHLRFFSTVYNVCFYFLTVCFCGKMFKIGSFLLDPDLGDDLPQR